jgi:hypothetical protein
MKYIVLLWVLVCSKIINAQSFKQSISYDVREISADYFLGKIADKQAVLLQTDTGFVVKLFNNEMAETETWTPKYLEKNVSALEIAIFNNELNIVYAKPGNDAILLYKANYNGTKDLAVDPVVIDTIAVNKNTSKVQFSKSKNGKYIVAWYEQIIAGDSMNLLYRIIEKDVVGSVQKVSLGAISYRLNNIVEISNSGTLCIVNSEKDKKGNYAAINLFLQNGNGKVYSYSPAEGSLCNNILSAINNADNTIHLWNWNTEIETGEPAIENIIFDITNGSIVFKSNCKKVPIDDDFDYANLKDGLFIPKQIIFSDKINSICVSEFYAHEYYQQMATPMDNALTINGIGRRLDRTINRYVSGNLLLSNFLDSTNLKNQVVRKEQVSEGKPSQIASFALAVVPTGLHFVHNKIERVGNIEMVNLKNNAQQASKLIESELKYEGVALYEQFKQIANNQILVPCMEREGVSFLQVNFD